MASRERQFNLGDIRGADLADPSLQQRILELAVSEKCRALGRMAFIDDSTSGGLRIEGREVAQADHERRGAESVVALLGGLLDRVDPLPDDIPHADVISYIAHTGHHPFTGDRF